MELYSIIFYGAIRDAKAFVKYLRTCERGPDAVIDDWGQHALVFKYEAYRDWAFDLGKARSLPVEKGVFK